MKHLDRAAIFTFVAALTCMATVPAAAAETESSIARGGRLYDKWWGENKAAKPAAMHPAYPVKGGKYADANSWRCKECHGWDYQGKDGVFIYRFPHISDQELHKRIIEYIRDFGLVEVINRQIQFNRRLDPNVAAVT